LISNQYVSQNSNYLVHNTLVHFLLYKKTKRVLLQYLLFFEFWIGKIFLSCYIKLCLHRHPLITIDNNTDSTNCYNLVSIVYISAQREKHILCCILYEIELGVAIVYWVS